MPKLHVAMYLPEEGNYEHWGLHLENGSENTIYEITGDSPSFVTNVVQSHPSATNRHKRSIFVAMIDATDMPTFKDAVSTVKPNNEVSLWNCQDYVLELLEKLEEECVIDGEDSQYVNNKEKVKSYFGPQI
ncbi:MAG: hypothetical protein M1813_009679 [Trichoglossum hirsutum]|nr:MAG: hypothetical protein M1813_009679 [Trichoglossum hirsutum]